MWSLLCVPYTNIQNLSRIPQSRATLWLFFQIQYGGRCHFGIVIDVKKTSQFWRTMTQITRNHARMCFFGPHDGRPHLGCQIPPPKKKPFKKGAWLGNPSQVGEKLKFQYLQNWVINSNETLTTNDITKYSTRVVIKDVTTIQKWRTAAILDFVKIAINLPRIEEFGSNFVCSTVK